ncbi:MAG: hypothetical protein IT384_26635 [Deltaproteobacteria bacterium]|nr:hypothetical protein [Deltaproteobacteria bacterium]
MTPTSRPWLARAVVALSACLGVLPAALLPSAAVADDDEWLLALEPGLGLFSAADPAVALRAGLGGEASLWLGVDEAAWIFLSGGAEQSLGDGPAIGEAAAGLALAIDVLRTIPFLEVAGGLGWHSGDLAPLLRLGLGADYLLSPSFSVGGVVRYRPFYGVEGESWLTFHLRFSYRGQF